MIEFLLAAEVGLTGGDVNGLTAALRAPINGATPPVAMETKPPVTRQVAAETRRRTRTSAEPDTGTVVAARRFR